MDLALTWWIRGYLLLAAVQGLGIGLTGLVFPAEMQIPLRITPLNARFAAALYFAGGVGVLLAAFSKRRSDVRLFIIGFGLATGIILILTLLHWSEFMADGLPHQPIWMFDYIVDPLLALIIVPLGRLWPAANSTTHRLTVPLNVQAVLLGVLGLFLLLLPDTAAAYWPWALPPLLGQLYGCLVLSFAIGAAFAARESSTRAVRDFLIASLTLCVLVLVVSALHADRFKPQPITTIWFAAFAVGGVATAAELVLLRGLSWRGRQSLEPRRLVKLYVLVLGAALLLEGGGLLLAGSWGLPIGSLASDARHNLLHVVWGLGLLLSVALRQAAWAAVVFGVFYVALAVLGVVLSNPFGLQIGPGESVFHFIVGPLALGLGWWAVRSSSASRASTSTVATSGGGASGVVAR
jgi:hypothetical protein